MMLITFVWSSSPLLLSKPKLLKNLILFQTFVSLYQLMKQNK